MPDRPPVTTVPTLDIQRYLGRWYEVARLPIRFEAEDATDITASYTLRPEGMIGVDNRLRRADGRPQRAQGVARPVDGNPARLRVSFLPAALRWMPLGWGDYWVMRLDPDYRLSLVGTPDRRFLWLLARDPVLPEGERNDWLDSARQQGFDLTPIILPRHTGRPVEDDAPGD